MKGVSNKKFRIFLVGFFASLILEVVISPIRGFIGLGVSSVAGFLFFFGLLIFLASVYSSSQYRLLITFSVVAGLLAVHLPVRIKDFNGTLVSLPDFLCHFLGIITGYLFLVIRKPFRLMPAIIGLLFAVFMLVKGYDRWLFRLNFGSYTASVQFKSPSAITGHDQFANIVGPRQTKNKLLVLDFWHTRCGVCFQKFPILQKLYDKMRLDSAVQFYAVNKPLSQDTANQAINTIKKYKYSFPVLIPDNDTLPEAFGVFTYPTTIIIDRSENVVYRGDIEHAERTILKLLEN